MISLRKPAELGPACKPTARYRFHDPWETLTEDTGCGNTPRVEDFSGPCIKEGRSAEAFPRFDISPDNCGCTVRNAQRSVPPEFSGSSSCVHLESIRTFDPPRHHQDLIRPNNIHVEEPSPPVRLKKPYERAFFANSSEPFGGNAPIPIRSGCDDQERPHGRFKDLTNYYTDSKKTKSNYERLKAFTQSNAHRDVLKSSIPYSNSVNLVSALQDVFEAKTNQNCPKASCSFPLKDDQTEKAQTSRDVEGFFHSEIDPVFSGPRETSANPDEVEVSKCTLGFNNQLLTIEEPCVSHDESIEQSDTGVAGSLALGPPEEWRREAWEAGDVDYLGRDSFDNIWRRICECVGITAQAPASQAVGAAKAPEDVAPKPSEEKPEAAAQAETSPAKEKLAETPTPADKPTETAPEKQLDAKPSAEKPVEPPVDVLPKPAETVEKPSVAEAKPAESVPAEEKPAETTAAAEKPVEAVPSTPAEIKLSDAPVPPQLPVSGVEKRTEDKPTETLPTSIPLPAPTEKPAEPSEVPSEKPSVPLPGAAPGPVKLPGSGEKPAEAAQDSVELVGAKEVPLVTDKPADPNPTVEKPVALATQEKAADSKATEEPSAGAPAAEKPAEPAQILTKPTEPALLPPVEKVSVVLPTLEKVTEPVTKAEKPVVPSPAVEKAQEAAPAVGKPPEATPAVGKPPEATPAVEKPPEASPTVEKPPEVTSTDGKALEAAPAVVKPSEAALAVEKASEDCPAVGKPAETLEFGKPPEAAKAPEEPKPAEAAKPAGKVTEAQRKVEKTSEQAKGKDVKKPEAGKPELNPEKSAEVSPCPEKPLGPSGADKQPEGPVCCPLKPPGSAVQKASPAAPPPAADPVQPGSEEGRVPFPMEAAQAGVCKKEPGTPTVTPPSGPGTPLPGDVPPEVSKLQATPSQPATPPASSHQTAEAPVPPKRKQGKNGKPGKGKK